MRHDQRRFVGTKYAMQGGARICVGGHLIGGGKRSVNTIQRSLVAEMFSQLQRNANGRYAWGLGRLTDTTAMPDPLTRQVRRARERAACRAYVKKDKKMSRRAWRTMLLYPELVAASVH